MSSNTGTTQACAACKYQRRKCSLECPLAPYFPPDQPRQFLNVHRLFGVSNVLRILRQVDPMNRSDAMKSIVYEAEAWEKDPVHGCFGVIALLQSEAERLREELEQVRHQIFLLEHQQNQHQLHSLVSASIHHPMASPWMYTCLSPPPNLGVEESSVFRPGDYDVTTQSYDLKLEATRQLPAYNQVSREINYESSSMMESRLQGAPPSLEHVSEQDLKNAAALFTLTSNH